MSISITIDTFSNLLESCSGRDQILRLIYYGSLCVADSKFCPRFFTCKMAEFCNHINECRTFLRLFDDIPMLSFTLSYGLGNEEPDTLMQVCGVAVNLFDQLYYPFEHVAWAADKGLLAIKSDRWWTISTICWAFSVYFNFCKCLRYFSILERRKENKRLSDENDRMEYLPQWILSHCGIVEKEEAGRLNKLRVEMHHSKNPLAYQTTRFVKGVLEEKVRERLELKRIAKLQFNELLSMVQCLSNLVHAVHWLPRGILWSGQLKEWQIGALGTLATVINLYQTICRV